MGRKGSEINKSANIARILHRLMTSPRGFNVEALKQELGIEARTYRGYRAFLEELPFLQHEGKALIMEEGQGAAKRLILRTWRQATVSDSDFQARFASIFLAQQMLSFLRKTPLEEAFGQIVEELQSAVSDRSLLDYAMRHADRKFIFQPHAPKDYRGAEARIELLLQGLIYNKPLTLTYTSGSSGSPYQITLEPLTLASSKSALYLMARAPSGADPDEVRFYAVDRISEVSLLAESFEYPLPQEYDPRDLFDGHFGIYSSDRARPHQVELIFADIPWLKAYLQERTWHPSQRFEALDDGRLMMRFELRDMGTIWRWLRSFGDDVELIKPQGPIPRTYAQQLEWAKRHQPHDL